MRGEDMAFFFVVSAIIAMLLLTLLAYMRYDKGLFGRGFQKGIYEYSDQQLLSALDNVVIKYHSMELNRLDGVLATSEPGISALYWCDLTRLYAFASEDEVFYSFLNSLSNDHWECIIAAYSAFKLQNVRLIAEAIYSRRDKLTLEQSEQLRYSIREANSRMQEELCFYIRHNIGKLK